MTNNTDITRTAVLDALADAVATNSALIAATTDAWFDAEAAVDAILAGGVKPNTNDDTITDEVDALAFAAVTTDGPWWVTGTLMDAETDELIGPATPAQIEASLAAGDTGMILIDADGDVIEQSSWDADQPGVRTVWVAR